MAFKTDKQRKAFFAQLNNPSKAAVTPQVIKPKKINPSASNIRRLRNLNIKKINIKIAKGQKLNVYEQEFLKGYKEQMEKLLRKDSDKDGVPDYKDCQPFNPKKQGKLHDITMNLLKKKEEFLEKRRLKEMAKLEATREKLEQSRAVKEVRNQKLQAKQAVINEITSERNKIRNLKNLNKEAKKEIFRESLTGRTIGKSEAAIEKTQAFFKKPSTKKFFKKLGKIKL